MSNYVRNAREQYLIDPKFHNIVDMLEHMLSEEIISPGELHDAANLAADRYNRAKHEAIHYTMRGSQV